MGHQILLPDQPDQYQRPTRAHNALVYACQLAAQQLPWVITGIAVLWAADLIVIFLEGVFQQ
jgi:hypothetical protein